MAVSGYGCGGGTREELQDEGDRITGMAENLTTYWTERLTTFMYMCTLMPLMTEVTAYCTERVIE
uniref:Uncharacterized protein n=1 Tax=Peronospora matthiolae TaxID=2874970 RepID=A0AAV1SZB0_9STRA